MVGCIVVSRDQTIVAGMQSGVFELRESGRFSPIGAPGGLAATHRFNDCTTDPAGRLLIGTMALSPAGEPSGKLYSFDGRMWQLLAEGFRTINGLAVSQDGSTLFVSDSHPAVRTVWVRNYDVATGRLGSVRRTIHFPDRLGRPDGAAIDAEGGYWVAGNDGWAVHRFDANGDIDRSIAVPFQKPSKPAFGGPGLSAMYVTSIAFDLVDPDRQPEAGMVVCLDPGVAGLALAEFRDGKYSSSR
jgi:sugar lactone lactonase YvrE